MSPVPALVVVVAVSLVYVFLRVGLLRMWCAAARGDRATFGQLVGGADRFVPLLGTIALRAVVISIGLLCLVLPGLLLSLGLAHAEFFAVDGKMAPVAALRASWDASVGRKGRLYLYLMLGGLLVIAGCLAAGIGAVVAASVVSVGLAAIYMNRNGTTVPPFEGSAS